MRQFQKRCTTAPVVQIGRKHSRAQKLCEFWLINDRAANVNAKAKHFLAAFCTDVHEGISGTKIKKRAEFLRMMADAERGLFELVLVKDISRFARNAVDLLESIRKLKSLGIETQFLTANMTSMGNSEFVLTVFGALAQEESANTSKRVNSAGK